jgi:hypothetical protein
MILKAKRSGSICRQVRVIGSFSVSFFIPPLHRRGYTVSPLSVLPSVCSSFRPSQYIFRRIFLSNYCWQKSDIWSQASYRYAILWEAFLDPSDSYFLFADLVGFYAHSTYMRGYHKGGLAHSSSCFFINLSKAFYIKKNMLIL